VPAAEFAHAVESRNPPTVTMLAERGTKAASKPTPSEANTASAKALALWDHLRAFASDGTLAEDPNEVMDTMTDAMRNEVHVLAPRVAVWLQRIGKPITEDMAKPTTCRNLAEPGSLLKGNGDGVAAEPNSPKASLVNDDETGLPPESRDNVGVPDSWPHRNLPDSEPFAVDDPWGDLQIDIVFKTEAASKGTIPNPDCNALREWKKDGLDVNVVRQVVMEGIKRKPVRTLFHFDKPVRERDAQLKAARSRPSVAAKPEPKALTDDQWTMAVKLYRDCGAWSAPGASPDMRSCEAPKDILESYGYGPGRRR
jgi:hypothetical protein